MSLISDLLSKVKRQDPRRDIPPLLKEAVMHTTADRKARSRFMIPLAIAAFAAAAGVGAIFLMDFFQEIQEPFAEDRVIVRAAKLPARAEFPIGNSAPRAADVLLLARRFRLGLHKLCEELREVGVLVHVTLDGHPFFLGAFLAKVNFPFLIIGHILCLGKH